jgi:drug/metabolite transporter (DMT)-like permease
VQTFGAPVIPTPSSALRGSVSCYACEVSSVSSGAFSFLSLFRLSDTPFRLYRLAPGYYALQYLSLSDATTISFLSPVLVGLLAFVILREPYSRLEALVGFTSLIGTIFIAKPAFLFPPSATPIEVPGDGVTPEQRLMAVGVALFAVLGASGAYLTIRAIGKRASPMHSISYFAFYCVRPLSFPLTLPHSLSLCSFLEQNRISFLFFALLTSPPHYTGRRLPSLPSRLPLPAGLQVRTTLLPPHHPHRRLRILRSSPSDDGATAGEGWSRYSGSLCVPSSFPLLVDSEASLTRTTKTDSNLIFAMILERLVFGRTPDVWSLLGACIIVGGAIRVALEKRPASPAGTISRRASVATSIRGVADPIVDAEEGRKLKREQGTGEEARPLRLSREEDDEEDSLTPEEEEAGNSAVAVARGLGTER